MTPMRDPIRNLVYYAQPSDLADVLVDGRQVVEDGHRARRRRGGRDPRVQQAGERMWSRWPDGDWAGRTLDEVAPQTYAAFDG